MSPISSPEHSPGPNGITFDVQKPELIYKAASEGESGELAHILLEKPIEKLTIGLESDASTFDLETNVGFDIVSTMRGGIGVRDVLQPVATRLARGRQVLERGGNFIFQGQRGTNLVISRGGLTQDDFTITTGKVRERIPHEIAQVIPSPELNEESLQNAIHDTIDVLNLVVEVTYSLAGKAPPNETVAITPPKRKLEGRGSRIAEGLLDKIEVERPNITFNEIGGQEEAKREIEGLAFALSNPELYKKWGTKPPKGILLYGPPGTGKTLMAKALASQADARFLHVKASDIGSKWYGESEQLIQQIFDAASANGKTIIYFDEVDSIVPSREGAHEATQKVIGTLLQNIDGLGASDNVMIVASTNRMQSIDPAMMRPGRLDRLVEVGLPDEAGREHILSIHLDKANAVAGSNLFEELNPEVVAAHAKDFSGADIAEIVRRTLEEKVRQEGRGEEPTLVTTADLLKELQNYESVRKSKPSDQAHSGQYL